MRAQLYGERLVCRAKGIEEGVVAFSYETLRRHIYLPRPILV